MVERPAPHQTVDRGTLQRAEHCGPGDPVPVGIERRACARRSAFGPTVGEHRGIHGACRGAGNRLDPQPWLLEQAIEHAPRERAVRSPALQGEIDQQWIAAAVVAGFGARGLHDASRTTRMTVRRLTRTLRPGAASFGHDAHGGSPDGSACFPMTVSMKSVNSSMRDDDGAFPPSRPCTEAGAAGGSVAAIVPESMFSSIRLIM